MNISLVKQGINTQPVLKSEEGAWETWNGNAAEGSMGRAPDGGLGAKPSEAERLSWLWRVISTLNPTLKVIYRLEIRPISRVTIV